MVQTDSLVGVVVDSRYAVLQRVGRGGMATVYRARDKRLERDVAIKLLHPHLADQPDFSARFNKEARAAAQLSSPYVVAVHDQGMWQNAAGLQPYLVMEYIPGPDVRSELARLGSLNLGTALQITEQILKALAEAHRMGLVHRDIKPENVMLTSPLPPVSVFERPEIHAKVADFGLVRIVSSTSHSSAVMGTVAYMAPEVASSGVVEAPADIYGVGIMLYEFLTGRVPFAGETPIATAYQHINSPVPRVAQQASWLPAAVDSLIGLFAAKNPADRPANATAALEALEAARASVPEEDLVRRIPVIPTIPASAPVAADHTLIMGQEQPPSEHRDEATGHTRALTLFDADHPQPAAVAEGSPPPPPGAPRRRKATRLILAIVLVALIACATAWYFLAGPGQRLAIPDVTGQEYSAAESTLVSEGLSAAREEAFSDDVAEGLVISTDPDAGTRVPTDQVVTLTVSLGVEQVEVPDLSGKTEAEAQQAVAESRLTYAHAESYSETVEEGYVVVQDLESGTLVDHDSTITVTISLGREPISVPSAVGLSKADAVAAIEGAGLSPTAAEAYSDTVAAGTVISQDPSEGTLFRNDPVTITVSLGPEMIDVPNVIGRTKSDAISILTDAGFTVKSENALSVTLGLVYSQSPSSGKAPKGSVITISIV
ncbi:Stk1 family PASTA domain-containing Ser/Thr kinase [Changpingibacter yushuensis]|uniref:Stk1 family PASTA domain-containing Ser/Thr kinase n=1 Tax=Changpingibacter yushuensis TaxID=2758440 RepID=UPI0015F51C7F|nr:Stk1 family PASTA domain-containing Ser/Thr kinase [Changpingibacter yushuensis]